VFKITLKSYDNGYKKTRKRPFFFMTFFNFARFLPVFLLKKRPFFARFFIKLSPFEELVTLKHHLNGYFLVFCGLVSWSDFPSVQSKGSMWENSKEPRLCTK